MEDSNEYENVKMEIRSLLISNREGCYLSEFKKQYRSMLGRSLPFTKFGCRDEVEFLSSMPDAVSISSSGRDYHLFGVADEKSKHIQKMVSKQKPGKRKPLGRLNPSQRFFQPSTYVPRRLPLSSSAPWRSYDPLPASSAPRKSYDPPPASSAPRKSYDPPPASSAPRKSCDPPPASSAPRKSYDPPPASSAPRKSYDPPPASSAPRRSHDLPPASSAKRSYELPPRFQNTKVKKELPQFVMDEIIDIVCKYPSGLSLRDVLTRYRHLHNKELSFKDYGFFTLQDCLEEIPSLVLKPIDNDTFVLYVPDKGKLHTEPLKMSYNNPTDHSSAAFGATPIPQATMDSFKSSDSESQNAMQGKIRYMDYEYFKNKNHSSATFGATPVSQATINSVESPGFSLTTAVANFESPSYDPFSVFDYPSASVLPPSFEENHDTSNLKTKADRLDDFSFNMMESHDSSIISENIRNNLIRVIENVPHGIWAREFPSLYQEITQTEFDLHSLGFYDLASFIDSVSDILIRRTVPSSKKDYLIFPAWMTEQMDRNDPKSAAFAIEIIIGNTRKILQANEEGVPLKEFLYVYSFNCKESLYFADLGFDSLENLLVAIAGRVPLAFKVEEGVKSVHLVIPENKPVLRPPPSPPKVLESFPSGIVSPYKRFNQQTLPAEMDLSNFFPVYVCSVINPEHIYIQLLGEDTSEALLKKYQDLEKFYSSSHSKSFLMKDVHIAAGSIGVALWPADMHWYRVKVMAVTSPETVRVFYVDYGTIEIIPKSLLRYIREEFFDFPTQAIRASLAYVKPPLTDQFWNAKAKQRILELCTDITVMAKIHHIEDGMLSLVLCDTNGDEDVYINDVLLKEHLARTSSDDNNSQKQVQCLPEIPPPSLPAPNPLSANATQSLPPPVQPTDPTQVIGMLLQAYSSLAANTSAAATPNFSVDPATITAAITQAAQNITQNPSAAGADFSNLFQTPSTYVTSPIPGPKPVTENWQYPTTSLDLPGATASCSSPSDESEIFDDVDDAFFDEFYQKVSLVTKRYVKRIRTGDGYMFHILIYDSKPFVSCGDICSLIWSNKDSDYLLQRLQNRESVLPNSLIWESQNEDMFDQLKRFHVKGFKELNDKTCILVYPLNTLVQILNIFGHPSAELRSRILSESSSFDAKHPMWMELSEVEIPDGEEEFAGKTDDDKLNRLCMYDLQTMRQGIRIRCQNLELLQSKNPEEEEKLRSLYHKVIGRIKEIEQICSNFADA